MGLIDSLRKADKKGLFKSADSFAAYSTGFLPLDYANGFMYNHPNEKGMMESQEILGIMGGTFTTFIGYSGTGKTTLADQIAFNIISPYPNGLMIHCDIEKTAMYERILQVTGAKEDDPRIILNKDHVAIEDVLEMIDDICRTKDELGDECKYELPPEFNKNGKPVKVFEPTVIILDSLAAFNSRDVKDAVLEGQMSTNREVGQISQFYTKCLNKMSRYNINIFSINHIKSKVDVNPYQASPQQVMMLRPGESLPRGFAPIYYAQNIFRTNSTKSNIYTMEDNGFTGFKCAVQVVKSKTSFIGSTVNLCFNSKIGFDPIYTLYESAEQMGLIEGRNPNLYFKGLDQYKFNRKRFRDKFIEERAFRMAVLDIMQPYFTAMLGVKNGDVDTTSYITIADLNKDNRDEAYVGPVLASAEVDKAKAAQDALKADAPKTGRKTEANAAKDE